jgi:hypothetical protein
MVGGKQLSVRWWTEEENGRPWWEWLHLETQACREWRASGDATARRHSQQSAQRATGSEMGGRQAGRGGVAWLTCCDNWHAGPSRKREGGGWHVGPAAVWIFNSKAKLHWIWFDPEARFQTRKKNPGKFMGTDFEVMNNFGY